MGVTVIFFRGIIETNDNMILMVGAKTRGNYNIHVPLNGTMIMDSESK